MRELLTRIIELIMMQLELLWSQSLLLHAKQSIGMDASPYDRVDDVVGCAESVTEILKKVRHNTPIIMGTWTLMDYLDNNKGYKRVFIPMPGNIILSPTGTGNGSIRGHVGIVGRNSSIMSANSANGLWMSNYTIETWEKRYKDKGGIPTKYYSLI